MTLIEEIHAKCSPALMASRHSAAIAAVVSTGRVRIASREIGIGYILMTLAPDGGAFLDQLAQLGTSDRNVYWSLELIRQGRFDVGLPGTRLQMQMLAQSIPELAPAFAALLALAEVADPVSELDVRIALGPVGEV